MICCVINDLSLHLYSVVVRQPSGSVDIVLKKLDTTENWTHIGKSLVDDKTIIKNSQRGKERSETSY